LEGGKGKRNSEEATKDDYLGKRGMKGGRTIKAIVGSMGWNCVGGIIYRLNSGL
jgi:hypothetical protein